MAIITHVRPDDNEEMVRKNFLNKNIFKFSWKIMLFKIHKKLK